MKKDNVLALPKKKSKGELREELLKEAEMYAVLMCKDDPTPEEREWLQAKLGSDPQEWRRYGDLTKEAAEQALRKFYLGYVTKASVMRGAEVLKEELGYEGASPIERLLIEQAVLCHLRLGMIEHLYSRNLQGSYRMDVGVHWEMRLTQAQRRFTKAITTLTKVRAMLRTPRAVPAQEQARKMA